MSQTKQLVMHATEDGAMWMLHVEADGRLMVTMPEDMKRCQTRVLFDEKPVKQVQDGGQCIFLLTHDGTLFYALRVNSDATPEWREVKFNMKIKDLSSRGGPGWVGPAHTRKLVFCTHQGYAGLWQWPFSQHTCKMILHPCPSSVDQVYMGLQSQYFLVMTDGSLCRGHTPYDVELIRKPGWSRVQQLTVFENLPHVLSQGGNLFVLDGKSKVDSDSLRPITSQGAIHSFSSSNNHAVFLMKDGDAFTWGNNAFGQCAVPSEAYLNQDVPVKVASNVLDAACWSTGTVLRKSDGLYYSGRWASTGAPLHTVNELMKLTPEIPMELSDE